MTLAIEIRPLEGEDISKIGKCVIHPLEMVLLAEEEGYAKEFVDNDFDLDLGIKDGIKGIKNYRKELIKRIKNNKCSIVYIGDEQAEGWPEKIEIPDWGCPDLENNLSLDNKKRFFEERLKPYNFIYKKLVKESVHIGNKGKNKCVPSRTDDKFWVHKSDLRFEVKIAKRIEDKNDRFFGRNEGSFEERYKIHRNRKSVLPEYRYEFIVILDVEDIGFFVFNSDELVSLFQNDKCRQNSQGNILWHIRTKHGGNEIYIEFYGGLIIDITNRRNKLDRLPGWK